MSLEVIAGSELQRPAEGAQHGPPASRRVRPGDPERPARRSDSEPVDFDSLLAWSRPPILDSLIPRGRDFWDGSSDTAELLEEWQLWSGRSTPSVEDAKTEFARTMTEETDLSRDQIGTMLDRIASAEPGAKGAGGAPALEAWLARSAAGFLARLRPWLPIWLGYVDWIRDWCESRGHSTLVFLCRDSLPFYSLARGHAAVSESGPSMALLHATRRTVRSPALVDHLRHTLGGAKSLAFVDTGCYGSVVPTLVDDCLVRAEGSAPAVFFFFSRNPLIFGYMNYLMAFETLSATRLGELGASPADFTIYAGDLVEALPKPYRVLSLSDHGIPDVAPTDALSFVLSGTALWALTEYASEREVPAGGSQLTARDAALARYSRFAGVGTADAPEDDELFDEPAPKAPATQGVAAALPLEGLAPQGEFFGVEPG